VNRHSRTRFFAQDNYLWTSAGVGALAWGCFMVLFQPGWAVALFLLAPLVVVPVGLHLIAQGEMPAAARRFWLGTLLVQPFAAGLLLPSFWMETGPVAAALALPWVGFTLAMAWAGAHLLRAGRSWLVALALLYSAVGGGWLILARAGARPLDFPDILVLATAVHFHYAGFLLPLIAAAVAGRSAQKLASVTAWAIVTGVPLVAVGITLTAFGTRLLELPATLFLAGACLVLAGLQFRLALTTASRGAGGLLLISSVALGLAMLLAIAYAAGNFLESPWLDIPLMLSTHGALQAFGFAVPGALGWCYLLRSEGSPAAPPFNSWK
jgi:hypothetical protein